MTTRARLASLAALCIALGLIIAPVARAAACTTDPATPKRQFRAIWISSVANIDWPSRTGLSVAAQQAEFRAWLDLAVQRRMTAVVVQVRPTADAFWPSPYEPWSAYLTGTQGRDPGYDPLAFMVGEAHARNLELHAWFNPYRVSTDDDPAELLPSHPARQHPAWRFAYGGKLYYNPGIPEVRAFIEDAVMDAVTRYDLDGVHLDDYFYPYPVAGQAIPDSAAYAQYGGAFGNVADWRRDNVDKLVRELGQRVHAAKAHVAFGISPFGIWRNAATDPLGSRTSGLQSYDAVYADSRRWVKQGWIDYIAPQIYWHIGYGAAAYEVLTAWWAGVVRDTGVQLVIGQAAYRAGAAGEDPAWQDPAELSDHLYVDRQYPEVSGDVYFSAKDVRANRIGAFAALAAAHYSKPALPPARGGQAAPPAPAITAATRGSAGVAVSWRPGGTSTSYAVYRLDGTPATADPCFFADARNLVGTTRQTAFTDTTATAGAYTYYVTALDRTAHESAPSPGGAVPGPGTAFSVIVDNASAQFTAGANWGTSAYSAQRYGADYRFADPVAATDPAWFRTAIPSAGNHLIEVWYPGDAGYNSATPFVVATATGNRTVVVDQRAGGGAWRPLGTFALNAGTYNVVGVSRWTSGAGYVIADAVRITRS